jgi:hypothetical protein
VALVAVVLLLKAMERVLLVELLEYPVKALGAVSLGAATTALYPMAVEAVALAEKELVLVKAMAVLVELD